MPKYDSENQLNSRQKPLSQRSQDLMSYKFKRDQTKENNHDNGSEIWRLSLIKIWMSVKNEEKLGNLFRSKITVTNSRSKEKNDFLKSFKGLINSESILRNTYRERIKLSRPTAGADVEFTSRSKENCNYLSKPNEGFSKFIPLIFLCKSWSAKMRAILNFQFYHILQTISRLFQKCWKNVARDTRKPRTSSKRVFDYWRFIRDGVNIEEVQNIPFFLLEPPPSLRQRFVFNFCDLLSSIKDVIIWLSYLTSSLI